MIGCHTNRLIICPMHVLQNQLSRSDTNGEEVADFVRNIQQSQVHVPNDFRHLGIAPGPRDDNSDNISITGISATAVPYTQVSLVDNDYLLLFSTSANFVCFMFLTYPQLVWGVNLAHLSGLKMFIADQYFSIKVRDQECIPCYFCSLLGTHS